VLAALAFVVKPARVRHLVWDGQKQLSQGHAEAALESFRDALRIDPDQPETHFWLARACRKTGDVEGVRRHLDESLRLGYEDPDRLHREWRLLLAETGRIREVEPYLAEMLTDPGEDAVEICDAFVRGYCLNLQFEPALTLLDAWESDYPHDFRPHFRRGRIHADNELQWGRAEAAYREALRRAPDNPDVHRDLGKTLLDLRKLEEAEHHLRQALQTNPADADALLALAMTLVEQEDHIAAATLLRRVLDQDPRNDAARLLLAKTALAADDAEEAIRQLTPLIELWPGDLKGRYCLAEALRAAGRLDEADAHFKAYSDLERNWQRMNQLKRIIPRRPNDPELRYEMGLLRLRHDSRIEGVAWLQSVFLYAPEHAGAHHALAEYYTKIGEPELARRHGVSSAPGALSAPSDRAPGTISQGASPP
jgi:tetratricopeptide (TPR) repeat protein